MKKVLSSKQHILLWLLVMIIQTAFATSSILMPPIELKRKFDQLKPNNIQDEKWNSLKSAVLQEAKLLLDVDALDEEVFEINTSITPFQFLNFEHSQFNISWQAADLNALWALPRPIENLMFANGFE